MEIFQIAVFVLIIMVGLAIVVLLKIREDVMEALNAAVAELEATNQQVLTKIAELKAAGDPVALQAATDKITAVTQSLKDAIA